MSVVETLDIVMALLYDADYVPQAEVVDAVDYSKSSVSRHLTVLENEGYITRVELGRRKLVYERGEEPEFVGMGDSSGVGA